MFLPVSFGQGGGALLPRFGSRSLGLLAGHSGSAPALSPGNRDDGSPMTCRGGGSEQRGLDCWAAEPAARRPGYASAGPLISLCYPGETKLPGTDARRPSFVRKPLLTLTLPCTLWPPAPRPKDPRVNYWAPPKSDRRLMVSQSEKSLNHSYFNWSILL